MDGKLFTLEEANALLPQIRADLTELQALVNQIEIHFQELQKIKSSPKHGQAANGHDPLFELETRIDFMRMEAELAIQNFGRKGVLLKTINPGLVDFPSDLHGRDVLLCWKEGEESITHYHGWQDGYMGRKLLADEQ
jgi:hypothetical protein